MSTKSSFPFHLENKLSPVLETTDLDTTLYFSKDAFYYKNGEKRNIKKYFSIPQTDIESVIKILETNHNLYELIPANVPVKPYFDLEMEDVPQDRFFHLLNIFKIILIEFFHIFYDTDLEDHDFIVLNSCRNNKLSFHLIIRGYFFENQIAQKKSVELLKDKFHTFYGNEDLRWSHSSGERRLIFDVIPYGKNQNFRLINQSKIDKPYCLQCDTSVAIIDTFIRVVDKSSLHILQDECETVDNDIVTNKNESCNNLPIENEDNIFPDSRKFELKTWLDFGIEYNLFQRLTDYYIWIGFGFLIKDVLGTDGLHYFLEISKQYKDFDEKTTTYKYESFVVGQGKCHMTVASIKKFYQDTDYDSFISINNKVQELISNKPITELDIKIKLSIIDGSDFDLASAFYELVKNNYKCVDINDKIWIGFNPEKLIWDKEQGSQLRVTISTDFYALFVPILNSMNRIFKNIYKELKQNKNNEIEDRLNIAKANYELVTKICAKLKATGNKNNIITELSPLLYEPTFFDNFNKALYMLPLRDGSVFDIRDCSVRQRTIDDRFSSVCNAVYKELSVEDETFASNYFNTLFCNNKETKQCVLDIIKSCLVGIPLRYFYFCIGSGCNGKSALFKLLSEILGTGIMDILSKKIIVGQNIGNSTLSTEFAMLDKCRIGLVSELSATDKLNIENLKTLSGGDKITIRELYKTERSITPTANSFTLLNPENIPKIDLSAPVIKRIVIIPFNAVFEVDGSFGQKMFDRRDDIFSYIMKYGVIRDKFNLSDEMKFSMNEFIDENTIDYLKDFLDSNYDITNSENDVIKRDDLRLKYILWLSNNKLVDDNISLLKFTKRFSKFGISNTKSNNVVKLIGLKNKTELDEDINL